MQAKIFDSAAEFREWLEKNHDQAAELWLGFYNKRTDKKSITYRDALDEALCLGWIDGVRKSVNETTYTQRFTPRKAEELLERGVARMSLQSNLSISVFGNQAAEISRICGQSCHMLAVGRPARRVQTLEGRESRDLLL